jgi:hypothetical protein
MVLFGAVAVLSAVSGCASGDPTDNEGTPTAIVSDPDVVFVNQGESEPVVVTVVDEDGQALEAEFTLSNVGAGITVTPDPDFLPVTGGNPLRRQARFFVQGDQLTAATFRVEALGLTKDIQVTSVPPSLAATFSNAAPALGDTITITAPAGTFFSPTSVVRFGIQDLVITARAEDGSVITFIPAPTIHGPLTVTGVKVTSNPNLTFTLSTSETLVTDSVVNVAATFSNTTPALGETVTLTLPAGFKVIPATAVGLTVEGAALPPRDVVVAADSGSIAFVPAPNSDSLVLIPGLIAARLPMYPLTVPTTTKVTTPAVTVLPSTLSSTTPAVNVPVVLASTDASFTFVEPATVTVGTTAALVTGQTASSITFLSPPGSTGVVSVGAVDVAGFSLALPSSAPSITTSSTVPAMAGTDNPATAPVFTIPPAGSSSGFFDAGGAGGFAAATCGGNSGVPCQLYRFTLAADATFDVTGTWSNEADIGLYFLTADGTTDTDQACDAHGRGADAQPEACTITLVAGTYLLGVVNFGPFYPENDPNPDWIGLAFSTPAP